MKPPFNFPYPTTPSHGAWCLAVALVAHADLNQTPSTAEILLEEVFDKGEGIPREWLVEATGRASVFRVTKYESADFEESSFRSISFFTCMGYSTGPRRINVDFLDKALPYLKQLQEIIHQLYQQGTLMPSVLGKKLKAVMPLAEFNINKDRRYKESSFALYSHNENLTDAR